MNEASLPIDSPDVSGQINIRQSYPFFDVPFADTSEDNNFDVLAFIEKYTTQIVTGSDSDLEDDYGNDAVKITSG